MPNLIDKPQLQATAQVAKSYILEQDTANIGTIINALQQGGGSAPAGSSNNLLAIVSSEQPIILSAPVIADIENDDVKTVVQSPNMTPAQVVTALDAEDDVAGYHFQSAWSLINTTGDGEFPFNVKFFAQAATDKLLFISPNDAELVVIEVENSLFTILTAGLCRLLRADVSNP